MQMLHLKKNKVGIADKSNLKVLTDSETIKFLNKKQKRVIVMSNLIASCGGANSRHPVYVISLINLLLYNFFKYFVSVPKIWKIIIHKMNLGTFKKKQLIMIK